MPRFRLSIAGLIPLALAHGCATVNPRSDYAEAARHVETATGQPMPLRSEDRAAVAEVVDGLLADGLTSDEAVQVALLSNPNVGSGFASIGMARADVVQSGLFSNPNLSIAVRFPDGGGLANIDLGLSQNIAELWLLPQRKRAAEENLSRRILSVARDVSVLAFAVRSAYFTAVSAERELEIAQENESVARQLVDSAEGRQQAGAGNTIDVNLARAGMLDANLASRTAALQAAQARRDLASLLGLLEPLTAELTEPLPDPPTWTLDEQHLVAFAEANRLDLVSAESEVEAAAARLELEKHSVFRNVELGLAMERDERRRSGNQNLLSQAARDSILAGQPTVPAFSREEDEAEDVILGPSLSLDLPIFDQNQAQIAKARYALEVAQSERDALAVEIAQTTRSAYDRAKTAWETARLYSDEFLPLLQNNHDLSREAYRSGKTSFLSVLETQQQLLSSRARYVQTLRESVISIIDLEKAAGRPLRELLTQTASPKAEGSARDVRAPTHEEKTQPQQGDQ